MDPHDRRLSLATVLIGAGVAGLLTLSVPYYTPHTGHQRLNWLVPPAVLSYLCIIIGIVIYGQLAHAGRSAASRADTLSKLTRDLRKMVELEDCTTPAEVDDWGDRVQAKTTEIGQWLADNVGLAASFRFLEVGKRPATVWSRQVNEKHNRLHSNATIRLANLIQILNEQPGANRPRIGAARVKHTGD